VEPLAGTGATVSVRANNTRPPTIIGTKTYAKASRDNRIRNLSIAADSRVIYNYYLALIALCHPPPRHEGGTRSRPGRAGKGLDGVQIGSIAAPPPSRNKARQIQTVRVLVPWEALGGAWWGWEGWVQGLAGSGGGRFPRFPAHGPENLGRKCPRIDSVEVGRVRQRAFQEFGTRTGRKRFSGRRTRAAGELNQAQQHFVVEGGGQTVGVGPVTVSWRKIISPRLSSRTWSSKRSVFWSGGGGGPAHREGTPPGSARLVHRW